MGRKKIKLTKEEVGFVQSYIEKKFSTRNWPSRETQQEAFDDFKQRPSQGSYAHDEVIRWCNKWLSDPQWQQLRNTLNSWRFRQRATEPPKKIQVSSDAWKIITTLAQAEEKTISLFIIDRFEAEYSILINDRT